LALTPTSITIATFHLLPNGEYQFASLADVPAGNFQLYLQSFGQTTATFTSPTYRFSRRTNSMRLAAST
jgi:hypothetical protein